MSSARRVFKVLAVTLVLAMALGAMPAFADDGAPVVTVHVTVSGTAPEGGAALDLYGMTEDAARSAIAASCTASAFAPLPAAADGVPFTFDVASAASCDATGMAAEAIEATSDTVLTPRWSVGEADVAAFVDDVAQAIYRKAVAVKRKIVKHRLKLVKQIDGRSVDTTDAVAAVSSAIDTELSSAGSAQATVTIPVTITLAKKRTTNIGKTILVVLHERRVYLYKNAKVQRKYRCAIGMPGHRTPKGIWKVVSKSKAPTWHNPGSAWAKGMPKFIGPGYYNPLGLRALYLNAPGIRIHGTSKTYSMGQAASHGCIRLTNKNIVKLYPLVPVGTPVYIVS